MLWSRSTQNVVDRPWMVYLRLSVTSLQGDRKQKLFVAIWYFNYILQKVDSHGIKIMIITLKNCFFTTDWLKSTGLKRHCFQYICYYIYIYLPIYIVQIYLHTYIHSQDIYTKINYYFYALALNNWKLKF